MYKKVSQLVVCLAVLVCLLVLMPESARAEFSVMPDVDVSGGAYEWSEGVVADIDDVLHITKDATLTVYGDTNGQGRRIYIGGDNTTVTEVHLTLRDVSITGLWDGQSGEQHAAALYISPGVTVHLTLEGNNKLEGAGSDSTGITGGPGIYVPAGARLIIEEGQGGGSLYAAGSWDNAGIGGGATVNNYTSDSGDIIINSGRVEAHSVGLGAGIGGGFYRTQDPGPNPGSCRNGSVTINGGTVIAASGSSGAGIGGGRYGAGGTITINDGTVYATSANGGAGIGGGFAGKGADITINGGTVTATGTSGGAGIGGGGSGGAGGTIRIIGGTVNATSEGAGAGIGGGSNGGDGGTIIISGGTVNATSEKDGAGIGGGLDGNGGTITISGGKVTATSKKDGAGIGGGKGYSNDGAAGTIIIDGGTVYATSGELGAGIGSGCGGTNSGSIQITGGTVKATGKNGAGIGGGRASSNSPIGSSCPITISGGEVYATSDVGAGIGGGAGYLQFNGGNGNNITISGGSVTAISTGLGAVKPGMAIGGGGTYRDGNNIVTGDRGAASGNSIVATYNNTAHAWHGTNAATAIQFLFSSAAITDISAVRSQYMHIVFFTEVFDYTVDFISRTLTDAQYGIVVSGDGIADISRLVVQPNKLHTQGTCAACDEIRRRQEAGEVIVLYNIALTHWHTGTVDVFIPFSGSDGYYTVLHCNKGVLEEQIAPYADGGVTTTWKRLSPFAVMQGVNAGVPENVTVDPPQTGDAPIGGIAGVGLVLCALGLAVVARKKRSANN